MVGRVAELDPPVQAVSRVGIGVVATPDGWGPAVPDRDADALVTAPLCVRCGALQLASTRLARNIPKAGLRTGNPMPPCA